MKVICSINEEHDRFVTTAHVVQYWVVDSKGTFLNELATIETTHAPNKDNTWTCLICGADAVVTE